MYRPALPLWPVLVNSTPSMRTVESSRKIACAPKPAVKPVSSFLCVSPVPSPRTTMFRLRRPTSARVSSVLPSITCVLPRCLCSRAGVNSTRRPFDAVTVTVSASSGSKPVGAITRRSPGAQVTKSVVARLVAPGSRSPSICVHAVCSREAPCRSRRPWPITPIALFPMRPE